MNVVVSFARLTEFEYASRIDTSFNLDTKDIVMKLELRNYMRVRDAAYSIGEEKEGFAAFIFTPRQVMEKTGFTRNTVEKYLSLMETDQVITKIVVSPRVTIYRFCKSYLMGITGDRLSSGAR